MIEPVPHICLPHYPSAAAHPARMRVQRAHVRLLGPKSPAERERGRACALHHGAIRAQLPALPPPRRPVSPGKKSDCLSSPIPEEGGREGRDLRTFK